MKLFHDPYCRGIGRSLASSKEELGDTTDSGRRRRRRVTNIWCCWCCCWCWRLRLEEEEHQFLVLLVLVVMSLICDFEDINNYSASVRINVILVKMTVQNGLRATGH